MAAPATTKPKCVQTSIVSAEILATWTWPAAASSEHKCGVCRMHIQSPDPNIGATNTIQATVSTGECGHTFHGHCLRALHASKARVCPECRTPWVEKSKQQ